MNSARVKFLFLLPLLALAVGPLFAHPVPTFSYDRVIQAKLAAGGVEVQYQLNVDEFTIFRDLARMLSDEERAKLRPGDDSRQVYAKAVAPFLADRLESSLDGIPLTFASAGEPRVTMVDHVQFDFVFRAPWPGPLEPGSTFRLNEANYEDQKGQVDLSFAPEQGLTLADRREPDATLKARPSVERSVNEERQLRQLSATIAGLTAPADQSMARSNPEPPQVEPSLWQQLQQRGPVALLDSSLGLGLVSLITLAWGAVHALTPGHGKTLVASYLVGERGTTGHAMLLGVVTTLTHAGVVLLVSIVLWLWVDASPQRVQSVLGFIGGFLIAGMGIWLLLRRLAGQADHFHVGGGHHHHHGDGDHHHHHLPVPADGEKLRVWNLVVLGIGGGIVPCWDAIAIQLAVIAKGKLWLGPPLILAFSIGLALTLVAVGIAVVKLKGFGSTRWGTGRVIKALPFLSAAAIIAIGAWLCVDSIPK
jgi:ABC-type nickel/cobalt efflux system permease component RcnA